jgi:hypothetical protein
VNGDGVTVGTKGSDLKSARKDFPLALVEGQEVRWFDDLKV